MFRLPDLRGKTVLDINAWDGFFSFEAERRGARRVVALDKMMWGLDLGGWTTYWQECKASNTSPLPFQDTPYWHPDTLPGKAGFDTAHSALSSRAESMVADFVEMDISSLGRFDVVLYLGSLYHMMDPLGAMRRVSAVTREHWVQSSSSFVVPRFRHVRHSLAIAPLSAVRGSHLPCGLA
jgi:tRNA (mo5U34)-methyltransferase